MMTVLPILAPCVTRAQAFPYCPNWALSWGSRRRRILREVSNAKCDVIALQVCCSTCATRMRTNDARGWTAALPGKN